MEKEHLLKNLRNLIRNSSLRYKNEFVWQDIQLTDEFKSAYEQYLTKNNYEIEFLGATAVITSSSTKYIYVPNQWFVIASFGVDVYEELYRYKSYFKKICDMAGKRPDEYAKYLRDKADNSDRELFVGFAKDMFGSFCFDKDLVEESSARLWRFVNDYSWWSGQKTIDRTDFHVSVILNMLNLVNVSQGYVGDIVSAYVNDVNLKRLVKNIDGFTLNMNSSADEIEYVPDEEIREEHNGFDEKKEEPNKKGRVKIKINKENSMKEIKYKG